MSTITGTIKGNTGAVASGVPVVFRYQSNPAIASGAGVYAPELTTSTSSIGQFSLSLNFGKWQMIVGSLVTYVIVVPDDSSTYDFTQILDPTSPVTQSVANPLAVLGLHTPQNVNGLRAVANTSVNRLAVLYSPTDTTTIFYRWDAANFGVDNDSTIIKPTDTDEDEPGRWLLIPIASSGTTSSMDYVETVDDLKAIPGVSTNKVRIVTDTDAAHALWYYVHGEATTPVDGLNVVRADDGLGNWHGRF